MMKSENVNEPNLCNCHFIPLFTFNIMSKTKKSVFNERLINLGRNCECKCEWQNF